MIKNDNRQGYYLANKERIQAANLKYWLEHKPEIHLSHLNWLHSCSSIASIKTGLFRRYFIGSGVCLRCGEINPFVLENHHIFKGSNFKISLCANCHALMDRFKESNSIWEGDILG
jgi:hypothetical protein